MIGSRRRVFYREDGSRQKLIIRRLQCQNDACRRISHELPDILVPYKRYDADMIEHIIRSKPGDGQTVFPCEDSTVRRIKRWFSLLRPYFEGVLRALVEMWRGKKISTQAGSLLPLVPVCCQPDGFLKTVVRMVTNSGRWVQTRSA